jgi:hypothetical protein
VDFNKLSTGDKIAGGAGILLVIGLLFLPWHKVEFDFGPVGSTSETRSAVQSPNSFWGWLALLLVLAIVVTIILRKLTETDLPALGSVSWADATFFAAIGVGVLLLIKLISETDALGWGLFVDLVLTGVLIYGAFLIKQEGDTTAPAGPPQAF